MNPIEAILISKYNIHFQDEIRHLSQYITICSYGQKFLGTQEQVWNSCGKWAIGVQATEVVLYNFFSFAEYTKHWQMGHCLLLNSCFVQKHKCKFTCKTVFFCFIQVNQSKGLDDCDFELLPELHLEEGHVNPVFKAESPVLPKSTPAYKTTPGYDKELQRVCKWLFILQTSS